MTVPRTALFLIGCVGSRLALVYLAGSTWLPPTGLKVMAVLAALVSLGFMTIFLFGLRKTGIETGGQPIWWNGLRPFHAATYATFAILAWNGHVRHAQAVLLLDVAVGLAAFLMQRAGVQVHMRDALRTRG